MNFNLHLTMEEMHDVYDLIDEWLERHDGMLNNPVNNGLNNVQQADLRERVTNLNSVLSQIQELFTQRLVLSRAQEAINAQAARNFSEGRANPRRNTRRKQTRRARRS